MSVTTTIIINIILRLAHRPHLSTFHRIISY